MTKENKEVEMGINDKRCLILPTTTTIAIFVIFYENYLS